MPALSIPTATYRLQLTPAFGFGDVVALLDHITALGVSDLYLSPITEANPGSSHGYDVVDHRTVRAEFGGLSGLIRMLDAAEAAGLAVIVDHVPNHMSVQRAELNAMWWTMLRDGPTSPSAAWFDVDWTNRGAVIVPVLGEPIADVLAAGGFTVEHRASESVLRYADRVFPVAPGTEHLDLVDLLAAQHYALVWWRNPARNVRRFFTIDDLVGVRVEDSAVASVVDAIPVMLCDHAAFRGVRVDHVDGLADPSGYLTQLRAKLGDRLIWVEKIVAAGESIPRHWPVSGTTGYESIAATERALVSPASARHLVDTWNNATSTTQKFERLDTEARAFVLEHGLRPDLERLHHRIQEHVSTRSARVSAASDRHQHDDDRTLAALEAITLGLDRYRTYLCDDALAHDTTSDDAVSDDAPLGDGVRNDEGASLDAFATAVARARSQRPHLDAEIELVADTLRSDQAAMTRWQQLTGPVMAKGAEDRAFYRYVPLASLCEVGGAPGVPSLDVDGFHRHQSFVQATSPQSLLAGTTHDTKRSEDVRARSLALADAHTVWREALREAIDACERSDIAVGPAVISLAAQTVVTAWPIDVERLSEYLVKSQREAGVATTWNDPDEPFEEALGELARMLCDGVASGLRATAPIPDESGGRSELSALSSLAESLPRAGAAYTLTTLAMRFTSPGIPDVYQGTEVLALTLVDPDNRRAPDWDRIRRLVDAASSADCVTLWINGDFDALKACAMSRLLQLRWRRASAFGTDGSYQPIVATGSGAADIIGYVRGVNDDPTVMVIARRGESNESIRPGSNAMIEMPAGTWRHVLDPSRTIVGGGAVDVSWWLDHLPVAVLELVDP
jgi:(1->4)-alpha-D-glucan 1-alpha-D-glucosylmutase